MTDKGKEKSLVADILNAQPTGPEGSYLLYGVPEGLTAVQGRVRFTTNYECKGERVLYSFVGKASSSFEDGEDSIRGKHILFEQHWELDVKRPSRAGKISPGQYGASFEVILPPTLPSSSRNKHGRISYILEVRLVRKWSLDVVATKEVWFLPTKLSMLPVRPQLTVATSSGYWKNTLPYSIILPSDVLHLGQLVPVTIRLERFLNNSEVFGKEMKLFQPRIRLKQYLTLTSTHGGCSTSRHKQNVIDMELKHWPKDPVLEFQDTVMLQLPMMPDLTPTTDTPVYSVRHSVNLMLGIIVKGLGGLMKIKVRVQIAGPQQVARHVPYTQVQGKVEEDVDEIKW